MSVRPAPSAAPVQPQRRRLVSTSGCVLMVAMGLLIWAKLRIAASIPRTVIAQPRQVERGAIPPVDPPPVDPDANTGLHHAVADEQDSTRDE